MNHAYTPSPSPSHRSATVRACAIALLWPLAAFGALAAGAGAEADAQARYKAERAVCTDGRSQQDTQTCLKEAGAALQASRSGELRKGAVPPDELRANRLARCDRVPQRDREECRKRITEGARSGSVAAGGVEYRHRTITSGDPAVPGRAASAP